MSVNDRTMSGIPIDAVYGPPADGQAPPPPGEYPYTRGLHPEMYRTRLWTMRMFAGFGSPEDTNARFRHLLGAGADRPLHRLRHAHADGLRPRPPAVGGRGRAARASRWPRPADMSRLFDGIDLGAVSTSMTISGPAPVALALFVAAAERRRRAARASCAGTLQADILKEFIAQKEWVVPERPRCA